MRMFLLEKHRGLPAYTPGDHEEGDGFVRLNTNESPYPPSPGVAKAIASEVGRLGYYNDPDCVALREALAGLYGVKPTQVIAANGSDELLYFAFLAFADREHPIALPDITYGYYDLFAAAHGIPMEKIPLRDDFTIDYRDYLGAGKTIVFPNPNAPTGYAMPVWQVAEIAGSNPKNVVIVDEAYVDFGAESCLPLIREYPNVLIVRTFSKSHSMAGARLGYGFGCERLIGELETIRNAINLYSVNRMTQAAGIAAVKENDYYMANCQRIIETRDYTTRMLREQGFEVLDSLGNFVFARPRAMSAKALAARLRERGILVRHWDKGRIGDYLRITIGTMQEMQALECAIEMIFGRA
ncbi:MAG: histidinol-phosphate transaminase [Clostridia bacterium]|nr:histidinol-phosphate transaminase [Clostridia bacterium]